MTKGAATKMGQGGRPSVGSNGYRPFGRLFSSMAQITSRETGRAWVFALAVATIVVWAVTGPIFGYSDTWQLVINTGTNIVTFLMVFLIQATQNRDAIAIERKLDDLLRAVEAARNEIIDVGRRSQAG